MEEFGEKILQSTDKYEHVLGKLKKIWSVFVEFSKKLCANSTAKIREKELRKFPVFLKKI